MNHIIQSKIRDLITSQEALIEEIEKTASEAHDDKNYHCEASLIGEANGLKISVIDLENILRDTKDSCPVCGSEKGDHVPSLEREGDYTCQKCGSVIKIANRKEYYIEWNGDEDRRYFAYDAKRTNDIGEPILLMSSYSSQAIAYSLHRRGYFRVQRRAIETETAIV